MANVKSGARLLYWFRKGLPRLVFPFRTTCDLLLSSFTLTGVGD
jgi:hypothetical protein